MLALQGLNRAEGRTQRGRRVRKKMRGV